MKLIAYRLLILFLFLPFISWSQDISLFQEFNGRVSYYSFGNTLNLEENSGGTACDILSESSAEMQLEPGQTVIAAYLYWAGPGDGDFTVALNGTVLSAQRFFAYELPASEMPYFGAFYDVTSIIEATGNANYTLTGLDLFDAIQPYCPGVGNATNFGGWAVTVVYEDPVLPLNQVIVFDGFESVSGNNPELDIELTNLDVIDNAEAKIGFLSWEGDSNIANNESLRLNGTILSNAQNPADNAFNGTNTFTGSNELFNMDIDVYSVANLIQPGDETALIQLTSDQDFVLINNVITVLNTALPDADIVMDNVVVGTDCGDDEITVDYTVSNTNGLDRLPMASVGFYANNILLDQTQTSGFLNVGASESGSITLTIPTSVPANFLLRAIVDDIAQINELDEDNNEDNQEVQLLRFPVVVGLRNLALCDVVGEEFFDLTVATAQIDPENTITFHLSEADANNEDNAIINPEAYQNTANPETIWIRVANDDCFVIDSFEVEILICPLPDATITVDNEIYACRQRDLVIDYTVSNNKGTALLPAATPIVFYADATIIAQAQTQADIPRGGAEMNSITIPLSDNIPDNFVLLARVDDIGNGDGIIQELNEFNNEFEINAEFGTIPPIENLPDLLECDQGFNTSTFDLTEQNDFISTNAGDVIQYFNTIEDAISNENPIEDAEQVINTSDPQTIYVRLENEICFTTASFLLTTENCPPEIYDGLSPNDDRLNDVFIIGNLLNVYDGFNLKIYSREGNLIYEGGNDDGFWNGIPNTGILGQDKVVPTGTYFYVLKVDDPNYPEPFIGDVYVNY